MTLSQSANYGFVKDKEGKDLIKKFTVPRQPTKANKAIWNEPDDPDLPPPTPKKRALPSKPRVASAS